MKRRQFETVAGFARNRLQELPDFCKSSYSEVAPLFPSPQPLLYVKRSDER